MLDIPPYIKDILLVVLAAPGFWTFLNSIMSAIGGKKKQPTLEDLSNSVKEVKDMTTLNAEKINNIERSFVTFKAEKEAEKMENIRTKILRFNDEVVNNTICIHSKESWEDIMRLIDEYEKYTKAHPEFKNSYAVDSIANLHREFKGNMHNHSL